MKLAPMITLAGLFALALPAPSEACGGHRGCRHGSHHRRVVVASAPAPTMTMAAPVAHPAMSYATPQMASVAATAPVATVAPTVMTTPVDASLQPSYEYAATPGGVPAYYYTYDSSGKMIVAQWMDWVFRGGRAAGEPAPPLPILGALRNR